MSPQRLFQSNHRDAAIAVLLAVLFGGMAGATRLLNPSVLPADWEPEILIQAAPLFLGAASCVFALWAIVAGRTWLKNHGNGVWAAVVSLPAGLAVAWAFAVGLGVFNYSFNDWLKNGAWLLVLLIPVAAFYRCKLRHRFSYTRAELNPWLWVWCIAMVCAFLGRGLLGMALVGVGLAVALGFSLTWSTAVTRALGYRHGWQRALLVILMLLTPLSIILVGVVGLLFYACMRGAGTCSWQYIHWLVPAFIPLATLVLSFRAWRAAGRVLREKREAA